MLAPFLIGRDPMAREEIFDDLKREIRQWSGMGHGPLDIALWDLAGKKYGASISRDCWAATASGCRSTRRPISATTTQGGLELQGGLCRSSPSSATRWAFAPTRSTAGTKATRRREAENVLHVAKAVGDRMTLMLDPANQLRKFSDALYVGRACDEGNYFWYEDPMRDNGKSAFMPTRSCAR